jgi:zinc protease
VRAACARYLTIEHAALTVLLPRDRVDARKARALTNKLQKLAPQPTEREPTATMQPGVPSVAARRPRTFDRPRRDGAGIWRVRHRSGLTIVARPDASVPMAAGWLVWPGGLRVEPARVAGSTSLIAALLNRGTDLRSGDALAQEIEGCAAVLDAFAGHDSVGLQSECLAEHLPLVLARMFECARAPAFAADELDEARRIVLADLEADADDPGHVAYRTMLALLFGKHAYGRDLRGAPTSLARLNHRLLARTWASEYPIGRAVLALAGDLELDAVQDVVATALEQVEVATPESVPRDIVAPSWPSRALQRTLTRERAQGQCVIGFPGLRIGDPECAALDVLCSVLGGQAGRLFDALREREGLVYQVGANSSEHVGAGHLVFYAAASQDKLDAARRAIELELARVASEPISVAELDRAKRWLVGQFESSLQRRGRVASRLVFASTYGLGVDYFLRYPERVAEVERAQVLALARRLLDPKRQVTVLVRAG